MPQALVVRLCNYIGDVVLSVPALQLLHDHGFQLHLVGKPWASVLLSGHPWPVETRASTLGARVTQLGGLRRRLFNPSGPRSPVEALAMPNSFSSALELRMAGLRTAGLARDGRSLLLKRRLQSCDHPHALAGFWSLACQLTGHAGHPPLSIGLALTEAAKAAADDLIRTRGWARGFVCVAPFCAGLVDGQPKRWPEFPALVQKLLPLGWPLVICPGPNERQEAHDLFAGAHVVEDLPLDVYAALLARSKLVVANDTGPAHMAAAVGARVISVLGPTKVEQWSPWGEHVQVLSERPAFPSLPLVLHAVKRHLD